LTGRAARFGGCVEKEAMKDAVRNFAAGQMN
jgi:hypothetical protein